jgi:uncharacterized lipoprotein YmbA
MALESLNQTRTLTRSVPSTVVLAMSAFALVAASGCSTTTRYYTLSSVESAATGEPRTVSPASLIGIGPVEIPDYVDIPNIVVRTGSNTLDQATFDQWGGSLDDMVPRVLVEDLAARMPTEHFVSFPQSGDLDFDFRVPVTFSQFDITATGEAVLIARWQIRGKAGSGMVLVHETTARAQADGASYQQRVAALSKALGIVTDEIAKALAPLPRRKQ